MLTGLFHLVTILASVSSCSNEQSTKSDLALTGTNYFCNDECSTLLEPFSAKVDIEVEPVDGLPQIFYSMDPAKLLSDPLQMKKNVSLTGVIDWEIDLDLVGDTAIDVIATQELDFNNKAYSIAPTSKSTLINNQFTLSLLSDTNYTVVLNPGGEYDMAPVYLSSPKLEEDSKRDFLVLSANTKVKGYVSYRYTNSVERKQVKFNARIMQGKNLISSVANISVPSSFLLKVGNGLLKNNLLEPIFLILEPESEDCSLPRVKKRLSVQELLNDYDAGDINLGHLKGPAQFRLTVLSKDGEPLNKASVLLKGVVGEGEVYAKRQLGDDGELLINDIYEGKYDLAVVPFDSKLAMEVIKIDIRSDKANHLTLQLNDKEALNAKVLSFKGEPINGAQVRLSRVGEEGNFASKDIYGDKRFMSVASTNKEGQICDRNFGVSTSDQDKCEHLLLDEGRYMVHVTPPAGALMGHKWFVFDFPEQKELAIKLNRPSPLVGKVLTSSSKPLEQAFITVYLSESNTFFTPQVIGNTITDDKGVFHGFVTSVKK